MIWWLWVGIVLVGLIAQWCRGRVRQQHRKQGELSIVTVTGIWVVYIGHLVLTLLATLSGLWPLPINDAMGFGIGCIAIVVGVGLFVVGIFSFGSLKRMNGRLNDKLMTDGIYRWSRNPQNVGWVLFLLGVSVVGKSGFAILLTGLFWIRFASYVRIEERQLEDRFGDEYRKYLQCSHRYFGPPGRLTGRGDR